MLSTLCPLEWYVIPLSVLVSDADPSYLWEAHYSSSILEDQNFLKPVNDFCDIFQGKKLPLKRGYIGIVNRSQDDITNNIDIEAARDKEMKFFAKKKCYE